MTDNHDDLVTKYAKEIFQVGTKKRLDAEVIPTLELEVNRMYGSAEAALLLEQAQARAKKRSQSLLDHCEDMKEKAASSDNPSEKERYMKVADQDAQNASKLYSRDYARALHTLLTQGQLKGLEGKNKIEN